METFASTNIDIQMSWRGERLVVVRGPALACVCLYAYIYIYISCVSDHLLLCPCSSRLSSCCYVLMPVCPLDVHHLMKPQLMCLYVCCSGVGSGHSIHSIWCNVRFILACSPRAKWRNASHMSHCKKCSDCLYCSSLIHDCCLYVVVSMFLT